VRVAAPDAAGPQATLNELIIDILPTQRGLWSKAEVAATASASLLAGPQP